MIIIQTNARGGYRALEQIYYTGPPVKLTNYLRLLRCGSRVREKLNDRKSRAARCEIRFPRCSFRRRSLPRVRIRNRFRITRGRRERGGAVLFAVRRSVETLLQLTEIKTY